MLFKVVLAVITWVSERLGKTNLSYTVPEYRHVVAVSDTYRDDTSDGYSIWDRIYSG